MTAQNTAKKLLPVGISSFSDLREMDYYYVDKTPLIIDLITSSRFVFLSRPRRFGKSLTLDTIAELFAGRKELFAGLYAEHNWDWNTNYPVIRLSFAGEAERHNIEELKATIYDQLFRNAKHLKIEIPSSKSIGLTFKNLILDTKEKYQQKVVILVDEYDKPIIDSLDNTEVATEVRGILKSLYSQIKDLSGSIRFAMLTGVSKFGQMSLFSGLNNLEDITLRSDYSALCGYTQEELETVFAPELVGVDLEQVKHWYNGYNWTGESVYNPFDMLLFFKEGCVFDNYWIGTGGNASFLMKLLKKNRVTLADLQRLASSNLLLNSTDVGNILPLPILFQTGYLTIDEVLQDPSAPRQYKLKFPNYEVRQSFSSLWIDTVLEENGEDVLNQLRQCLRAGDTEQLQVLIRSALAKVPSDAYRRNSIAHAEGYWQSAVGMYFAGASAEFIMEAASSRGRADLVAIEQGNVYLFEFKVKQTASAQEALEQINDKDYAAPYRSSAKQIFAIGVSFDEQTREIEFAVQKVS